MNNPNCCKCIHRRSVPGDAHSECKHPFIEESPLGAVMALLGVSDDSSARHKLDIQANAHGVKMGWFMWPLNFDPAWLENCDGYEEKEE
jgi:hypothetical protein